MPGHHWHINKPHPVVFVPGMALLLKHPELRADGGITRLARQLRHDLGGCGASPAEEDVHDLPLATGQCGVKGRGHSVIFVAVCAIEITPPPAGCQMALRSGGRPSSLDPGGSSHCHRHEQRPLLSPSYGDHTSIDPAHLGSWTVADGEPRPWCCATRARGRVAVRRV